VKFYNEAAVQKLVAEAPSASDSICAVSQECWTPHWLRLLSPLSSLTSSDRHADSSRCGRTLSATFRVQ
jgi:hypothetical protein